MSSAVDPNTVPERRLSLPEFIALMGMMFATIAFSIDAMLPALPEIAADLTPDNANRAQLILTSFVLGMGVGTLFAGPLSDAFGRKRIILFGAALYITGASLAFVAPSLELILVARVIQGLGAAGPRVVSLAIMRDLYSGRQMARVVSFAMLIFTLFPAVAPLIGTFIIAGFGWRAIFLAFLLFSVVSVGWLTLRQPETLPVTARRALSVRGLWTSTQEALGHRQMQLSIIVQMLIFGALFGTLSSVQQVFDQTFGLADSFPYWFAAIALIAGAPSLINAAFVVRFGMRPLIRIALMVQVVLAFGAAILFINGLAGPAGGFWIYFIWTVSVFTMAGFTIGNLNALALEPLGHIAGLAASLMGSLATVGGAVVGAVMGQLYDGTPLPLAVAVGAAALLASLVMRKMPRESA